MSLEQIGDGGRQLTRFGDARGRGQYAHACLLYTSDAADERSSVDLGGRRIIKKKNNDSANRAHNVIVQRDSRGEASEMKQ